MLAALALLIDTCLLVLLEGDDDGWCHAPAVIMVVAYSLLHISPDSEVLCLQQHHTATKCDALWCRKQLGQVCLLVGGAFVINLVVESCAVLHTNALLAVIKSQPERLSHVTW